MSSFPISITWSVASPPTASFDSLAKSAQSLDQAMLGTAGNFDKFGQSVSQMEGPLSGVSGSMGQLEGSMSGLEGSLSGAAGSMGEFAGSTEQLNSSISETGGFVTDASGSMTELSSATGETGGAMTELSGTTGEFNGSIQETGGFVTETGASMTEMGTAATDSGTAMTELSTATTDTNTVLTESVDALGNVVPGLEDTATGAADSAQGFSDLAPPIEDTNTALDSSSGLLEGVSPLLADTGTNAGDAALGTGDFSGALGGLNTELGPVNGGLTESNTLVGDLGTEASTTADTTNDLKGSMSTLAFGLTTVVGAGYGLVNSFLGIRDAGFKVDQANIRIEKSSSAVDKVLLAMSKSLRKLGTDSEAPIKGFANMNAALVVFTDLVKSGVTSGPQYTEALNNLKLAADGLEGSTTKDNQAIQAFQNLVGTAGTKVSALDLNMRKGTKANEGMTKSYVDAGLSVATFVGGLGTLIPTITGAGAAAVVLKGAFVDLGIVMSQSVLPAIAGVAVPVGIAIGALAAFVAAVTAIRANIQVFDDLGVKVGEVFPQLKDFLDTSRQAFINFSDGMNTAISLMLGGLDSLTGGTTSFQKEWDKFTGTLPKGTGELGRVGLSAEMVANQLGLTNTALKVGAGKWKEIDGELRRTNGSLLATAGNWDVLADGTAIFIPIAEKAKTAIEDSTTAQDAFGATAQTTGVILKEQSANFSELTAAQKFNVSATNAMIEGLTKTHEEMAFATAAAVAYLEQIAGVNTELFASNAIITGVSDALQNQTSEHFEAVRAATAHVVGLKGWQAVANLTEDQVIALSESIKEEEKSTGKATDMTAKHVKELENLQKTLVDTGAELTFYAAATNMAARMQLEFNTGALQAKEAINDESFALANLLGQMTVWNDEAKVGQMITNALARGFLEASKAVTILILNMANGVGAIAALRVELESSGGAALRFAAGLIEGKKKALEWIVGVQQAKGEAAGFREEVLKFAQEIPGAMTDMSSRSIEQLQQFIEVVAGVPEAFNAILDDLDAFGQKMVEKLGKAGEDGKVEVMKNIEALEEELNTKFSDPLKEKIKLEVERETVQGEIEQLLGVLALSLRNNPLEVQADVAPVISAIDSIIAKIDEAATAGITGFEPLRQSLENLRAIDFQNIAELAPAIANVVQEAQNAGAPFESLTGAFSSLPPLAQMTASELDSVSKAFSAMGLTIDTTTGKITDGTGQMVGQWGQLGPAAGDAASETDSALLAIGASGDAARDAWARDMQIMFLAVDQFGKHAQTMAGTVSGAYSNMSANVTASLNKMASGIIIVIASFAKIQSGSQSMASTVSGSFSNMASNTISSMNRMASGIIIIIASFTRIISDAGRMNSAVSSAMSQMASRTSSFASSFQSAMSRVNSSATSATSRVRALQSAINALKSKTITITTIIKTVRQTVFAAQGGAFVQSTPGKVGPLSVSEFGQKELVTVTPLQTPGRQTVKGLSNLIQGETEKKTRRLMDEDKERRDEGRKKEMVLMRETPIELSIDGRVIARVVNRRLFEESDALV